ncbi:MAG: MoxR family ATPase [Mycobacteriaceae bacterium]
MRSPTSPRPTRPRVLGREREVELLVAALDAGAHVILEGPPGTGKTTLLRSVAADDEVPFVFVEGNAELTPARLVGHFDPAQLLEAGYNAATFVDGPLVQALRAGALLYVEEVNRVPEETLNVLITVMSEAELHVPRLGRVVAEPGFRLVAAMNPFDAVGTARISAAVYDRVCRITMGYQSADDEAAIVAQQAQEVPAAWRAQVVQLIRSSRSHPDIRVGSSVRGAIDLVRLVGALAPRRNTDVQHWRTGLDAALVALSGRVRLHESCRRSPEEVVRELYEGVFGVEPTDPESGSEGQEDGGASGGA